MSAVPNEIPKFPSSSKAPRLTSLDVFRGLTIAGMILVNNSSKPAYPPFGHAEWDGLTPTDLVFPSFVFIVGAAIPFSFGNRRDGGGGTLGILFKILRRTLIIFGIGILLHAFPSFDNWATIRIPGVLQRLALCYFFASTLSLIFGPRALAAIAGLLLAGYALAMTYVPIPDGVAGDLSRSGNLAAYVDRLLLGGHLYKKDYDPEGILSTIPAVASALIGVLAGLLLRSKKTADEKVARLAVGGVLCGLAGYFWTAVFPINKALWSPPFVLISGSFALLLLAALYWIIDLKGWRGWSWPFKVYGMNALAAFILAGLLGRVLGMIHVAFKQEQVTLRQAAAKAIASIVKSPPDASLCYALAFDLVCFFFIWIMYRYKVFLKA